MNFPFDFKVNGGGLYKNISNRELQYKACYNSGTLPTANFWAHLCELHGGLICVAFRLSVRLSVCPSVCLSVTNIRLDNNSYLVKYVNFHKISNFTIPIFLHMQIMCSNLKVGSMPTSSCIFWYILFTRSHKYGQEPHLVYKTTEWFISRDGIFHKWQYLIALTNKLSLSHTYTLAPRGHREGLSSLPTQH